MKQLILASGSPRRKELLTQAQLTFTISTSSISEQIDEPMSPKQVVETLASQKAKDVFNHNQDSIVIGADTVVAINDTILGKPSDAKEARQMLTMLSGNTHEVYTGVAIVSSEHSLIFHEKTLVTFWDLTLSEINKYIESGEPFDKAGSYGIQGLGALFVKEIQGDYYNVVGLPLAKTVRNLRPILQTE